MTPKQLKEWVRWLKGTPTPPPSEDYGSAHDGADGLSSKLSAVDRERRRGLDEACARAWREELGRLGHGP